MLLRCCPASLVFGVLVIGIYAGTRACWCPLPMALLLGAAALALRGPWSGLLACAAAGLILGRLEAGGTPRFESRRPVTIEVRVREHWRREETALLALGRSEWLRQGPSVTCWRTRLLVLLPPSAPAPRSTRLRIQGYLARTPALANGIETSPRVWVVRAKSMRFVQELSEGPVEEMWWRPSRRLREVLGRRLDRYAPDSRDPAGLLVRSLVLGEARALPKGWLRGIRSAGLSHLVALSGLHVGLLASVGWMMGGLLPRRLRLILVWLPVLFFLLCAGPRPSLLRTVLMLLATTVSLRLGRVPPARNILAWVGTGMVLVNPSLIRDLGFQLTVSATAGLLYLGPVLMQRWRRLPPALRLPLALSVGAHLGALPWALPAFHLLTPGAAIWNLVAVPWIALALATAMLWVVLALVVPPVSTVLLPALSWLTLPFAAAAQLAPRWTRPIPVHVGRWSCVALAIVLIGALRSRRAALGVGMVVLSVLIAGRPRLSEDPELALLDVGQGDAILLRDGRAAALVDGGGWRRSDIAVQVLLGALSRLGVRRLEAVILTHPDQDHCGGLVDLLSYVAVKRVLTAPGWGRSPCTDDLLSRPALEVRALWRGESAAIGRWQLTTLHPPPGDRRGRNNRSLVMLARFAAAQVVLTGDLEGSGERAVLDVWDRTLDEVDILKIGHHGSASSSTGPWLDRLRPRLALLSCGAGNRYGHPDAEVVERLAARGIPLLRTDRHGLIRVAVAAGGTLRIELPGGPRDLGPPTDG